MMTPTRENFVPFFNQNKCLFLKKVNSAMAVFLLLSLLHSMSMKLRGYIFKFIHGHLNSVGIHKTIHELFNCIIWTGVLYLKSEECFLGDTL